MNKFEEERFMQRLVYLESQVKELLQPKPKPLQQSFEILQMQREIEMMTDKYNSLSKYFQNTKSQIDSKVNSDDFYAFTQKIATEYATIQFLDLSLEQVGRKYLPRTENTFKFSKYIQKNEQKNQVQTVEIDEQMNKWKETMITQIRQLSVQEQEQAQQDILKPFRDQINLQVQNCYTKLHTLEEKQLEFKRHIEANELQKVISHIINLDEKIGELEFSQKGLKDKFLKLQEDSAKQQDIKIEKQKKKREQIEKEKVQQQTSQIIDRKQLNDQIWKCKSKFIPKLGAELLLRINQSEDSIKIMFEKEIFEELRIKIIELQQGLEQQVQNFHHKIKSLQDKFNKETQLMNELIRIRVEKSELIQILDNPQYTIKMNSQIQSLQERYKELYKQQIDLIDTNFKFSLKNKQSANVTLTEKINQKMLLIKKCDNIRNSLTDFFGQSKQNSQNELPSDLKGLDTLQSTKSKINTHRPQSVGQRKLKIRISSATPDAGTSRSFTFSQSQFEPQFIQRIIQNPLVKNLKH